MSTFKEKTRLYKVYHIHVKGNNDLQTGYVGITRRSLPYRLGQHFNSKRPVGTILRLLGREQVEIDQLAMLCKEEALEMEAGLRPFCNMGWNTRAGGIRRTVRCPRCGKHLPKRVYGTYCGDCRETKFTKGHKPHNYGKGEKYRLISPDGEVFEPVAFTVFCREHGLEARNLRLVAKGKRKHHKQWKAEKIEG